jgi:hypothetical protein
LNKIEESLLSMVDTSSLNIDNGVARINPKGLIAGIKKSKNSEHNKTIHKIIGELKQDLSKLESVPKSKTLKTKRNTKK